MIFVKRDLSLYASQDEWLKDWHLDNEAQLFFVLRWQELFNEHTFDSWQVRTCNIRSILREISEVVTVAEENPQVLNSLKALFVEGREICQSDLIVKKEFGFAREGLDELEKCIDNAKPHQEFSLPRRQIAILLGLLSGYSRKIADALRSVLNSPPEKYKSELCSLTMSLAVESVELGYSLPFLRNSWKFLTQRKKEFSSKLSDFLASLSGADQTYTCVFPIRGFSAAQLPMESFRGIRIASEATKARLGDHFHGPNSFLLEVEADALDSSSAKSKAQERLEHIFAALRLYDLQWQGGFEGKSAIVLTKTTCNEEEDDTSRLGYMKSSRNAWTRLGELAGIYLRRSDDDQARLNAVLQYHSLALAAQTDDARLVNLWIAIESLVRSNRGPIIGRVCDYLPATVSTSYYSSTLRNLAIDLRDPWRLDGNVLKKEMGVSKGKNRIPLDGLATLLLKEPGTPGIVELYRMSGTNPLMVYRLCRLQKALFSTPDQLKGTLEKHCNHIDWQIRRIYRARNYVVHHGTCPPCTRQLIQHLHSYFVVAMYNLVNDLGKHPDWDVLGALEYRRQLFQRLQDKVAELCLDQMLSPDKVFEPAGKPMWPDDTDASESKKTAKTDMGQSPCSVDSK